MTRPYILRSPEFWADLREWDAVTPRVHGRNVRKAADLGVSKKSFERMIARVRAMNETDAANAAWAELRADVRQYQRDRIGRRTPRPIL